MTNLLELIPKIQTAYDDLQQKTTKREEAAALLEATTQDQQKASVYLKSLQDEFNAVMGKAIPAPDPRFRSSSPA